MEKSVTVGAPFRSGQTHTAKGGGGGKSVVKSTRLDRKQNFWPLKIKKKEKITINYYLHTRGIYTFIYLHTDINRNGCDLLFRFYVPVADVIERPPALCLSVTRVWLRP